MDAIEVIQEKLDAIIKTQEEHTGKLDILQEDVESIDESVKNINLTARDYEVDYE